MLLWICFAVLTAAVVAYLLQPLRQPAATEALDASAADLSVYRDQLEALEAERESGLVSADEIEGARAEVARRLLKRAELAKATDAAAKAPSTSHQARTVYMALAGIVPLLTIAVYVMTGAPNLPSRPFAARQSEPVQNASIADVIARIEEQLRSHPDDGKGWEVIAPVYLRLGRYADAAHSYAEANRILGETTKRLLGFAEATMMAENGVVTEPVRQASLRILQIEPGRAEPKIWLALAKEQDGDLKTASLDYQAILNQSPADAPWREALTERITMLAKKMAGEPVAEAPAAAGSSTSDGEKSGAAAGTPGAAAMPSQGAATPAAPGPGPSAADVARVDAMTAEDRQAFINRMVEGLAERLKADGKDLAGWLKLARALKVLGRDQDAATAVSEARRNFAGDDKAMAEIDAAAKSLGL